MMKHLLCGLVALCLLFGCGCAAGGPGDPAETVYTLGFAAVTPDIPEASDGPLYIAGYRNGKEITGVLDRQQVRAVWLDNGDQSTLLIAVDCVGLGNNTVREIRRRLAGFCRRSGCDTVNVIATHTHAGIDTLGLWGPVAIEGKNAAYTENVIRGAVQAAQAAYEDRSSGTLAYSATLTEGLQEDSRNPQVYDPHLYQLRFTPDREDNNGIRILSFAAHAEALRGDNTLVSRDYPGVVCDLVHEATGDDVLFLPGAIGGLILTPALTEGPFDAVENLRLTGQRLAAYALSPADEQPLEAHMDVARVSLGVELDNTLFRYYKFLGILQNDVQRTMTGKYRLKTELTLLQLGDVTLALLPGEICPELVTGTGKPEDPPALADTAAAYGISKLMVVGLANDEIGYILPPSDFLLHGELPYLQEAEGDHYEETNSVGSACAPALAKAFEKALRALD